MRHDVPELRFATARLASGPQVHYAVQGDPDGQPILFLHGYTDSWFSFSRLLPLLPISYRAFAFDQRGHGDSERSDCCYAIEDLVADAVAFLDAVEVEQAAVVGHSGGSFTARVMAETHAERVTRLVLIGSAVTPLKDVTRELQAAVHELQDPCRSSSRANSRRPTFTPRYPRGSSSAPWPRASSCRLGSGRVPWTAC
jgi:pimeloyl-ACP methyl ester carboxylesterase